MNEQNETWGITNEYNMASLVNKKVVARDEAAKRQIMKDQKSRQKNKS